MNKEDIRLKHNFLPKEFKITDWNSIKQYFVNLEKRDISKVPDLEQWLKDKSELESVLEEELAWRYIKMNCDTLNKKLAEHFNFFIVNIEPEISKYSDKLNKKFVASKAINQLNYKKYFVLIRSTNKRIELFREENVPIFAKLQQKEQEYGVVSSKMTIQYEDKELTLQQASNHLKEIDRDIRKEVYNLISERRKVEIEQFDKLLSELISMRHQIAINAGYSNFSEYKFDDLGRFDYTQKDCLEFHDSIKNSVVPIVKSIYELRKQKLGLDTLKPFDIDVDVDLKQPLKPFKDTEELVAKTIKCFSSINPEFAGFIKIMHENNFLDLDSRKGKAPGGFNYPLYESNIPFIFMNATGNLRDVETIVHEGGHAIHSFLSASLELSDFKNLPSEVAELASMSMELISMEHWDSFFENKEELKRAKFSQLEGIIKILPWIAKVDKFQNWLYDNYNHNSSQRKVAWKNIAKEFDSGVIDWRDNETDYNYQWQKQLHIFEVPFYYIEYGIAQLGAIAIWRNYKQNPKKALNDYIKALKLGYSVPIPEIYETAGIKFNFSNDYVSELMQFLNSELEKINL